MNKLNLLQVIVLFVLSACAAPAATAEQVPTPVTAFASATPAATPTTTTVCTGSVLGYTYANSIGTSLVFATDTHMVERVCGKDAFENATEYVIAKPLVRASELFSGSCYQAAMKESLSFTAYRQPDLTAETMYLKNGTYFRFSTQIDGWFEVTFEQNVYYLPAQTTVFSWVECP